MIIKFLTTIIDLFYLIINRLYIFLFFILQNATFHKTIGNYNEFVGSQESCREITQKQGETKR
ncbi:hypothetical protein J21TS3_36440 [Paenibacillus cookii]|uniref:Uncharacterized protein n=1 Tax=Paenibacillus cookii TaxID=157839 RepID=A0ABQ4M100_9BACL|nr:hypothetical protein J21TS3_36440 [Paenibacillus cookii]